MVPFQPHHSSLNDKRATPAENLAKKRKWEEEPQQNSLFDVELQLETPLPFDWQRCLDIQSGKIHFYNTTTQKRTSKDPRDQLDEEEEEEEDMSLDLELNLTCESLDKNNQTQGRRGILGSANGLFGSTANNQKEMVAAVCTRCHLLVMLCKSSPECPNCKFMHSPEQTPPTLFKRSCRLSW